MTFRLFLPLLALISNASCNKCGLKSDFSDWADLVYTGSGQFGSSSEFSFQFSLDSAINNQTASDWQLHTVLDFGYHARLPSANLNTLTLILKPTEDSQSLVASIAVSNYL